VLDGDVTVTSARASHGPRVCSHFASTKRDRLGLFRSRQRSLLASVNKWVNAVRHGLIITLFKLFS